MQFTDEEQFRLFNKLNDLYFKKNFGSMSKTDFETLLFSEYVECCIDHGEPFDDYSLSKELGLTQSRIRSLKERKELKYPRNNDPDWWKAPFAQAVKNANYDEKDHYVKFIIQDINVMNETRHFIEESGWYDECSLNKKLLSVPLDCFTEICLDENSIGNLFNGEEKKAIRKIAKDHSDIKDFVDDFTKDGLKKCLMSASKETICLVLQTLPFGGVAEVAFRHLFNVISKV